MSPGHACQVISRSGHRPRPIRLGVLPGWASTDALDLSHDGQTVVGRGRTSEGIDLAFIWTSTRGLQDLAIYLDGLGVDLAGWQLQSACGISGDGTAITGTGTPGCLPTVVA